MINKYNIGDKIKTRIHYKNDPRTEIDATIIGIELENNNIKYKIKFDATPAKVRLGCTECEGYVAEDDIIKTDSHISSNIQLYWVSLLIQDTEHSKPWVCAMTDGYINFEEAIKVIKKGRKRYRVLCAWIDSFDENGNKSTEFHECYVNAIGRVELP